MTISYASYAVSLLATLATKADKTAANDTHTGAVAACCTTLYTLATNEIARVAAIQGVLVSELESDTVSRAVSRVGNAAGKAVADAAAKRSEADQTTLASNNRSNTSRVRAVMLALTAVSLGADGKPDGRELMLAFGVGAKRVTFTHSEMLSGASIDKCYRAIAKAEKAAFAAAEAADMRDFAPATETTDITSLSDDAFMAEYQRRMTAAKELDVLAQAA